MKNSRQKYIEDQIIRSNENYDQIYRFLSDDIFVLGEELDFGRLYDLVKAYISKNFLIKNGKIEQIEYHERFGWIIKNSSGKAFLGKMIIAGSPTLNIGKFTYFSGQSTINGTGNVDIGSFTSVANGLQMFLSNINHPMQFATTFNLNSNSRMIEFGDKVELPHFENEIKNLNKKRGITVGNDVWIGRDVMILNGIKIGDGCVIGARSTIIKNCEPYGVYAGTPARLIKYRFGHEMIDQLLNIKWWKWPLEKIKNNKLFFDTDLSNVTEEFFKKFQE